MSFEPDYSIKHFCEVYFILKNLFIGLSELPTLQLFVLCERKKSPVISFEENHF